MRYVRTMTPRQWLGWGLLLAAGALIYVAFQSVWQGVALFVASVLINIAVDHIMLRIEKARGEVD